jgi:hypothetical protein
LFEIEESFKGIPVGTKQFTIDPGSFTSCYMEYNLGKRYLVFALRTQDGYLSAECMGSRSADGFPHIEQDLAMLRAYRDGKSLPKVFGYVYLDPFRGWPMLTGPKLAGARVTISNGRSQYRTTTRADGSFAFNDAPPGKYSLTASMFPFAPVLSSRRLEVPPIGCGTEDFPLMTASTISGVVLDHRGRPVAKIPVKVEMLDTEIRTETDTQGNFTLKGIPEMDVRLAYGSSRPSSEDVLYPKVFAETLRLQPGEHKSGLVLWLPPPPKVLGVAIKTLNKDGTPANNAFVNARFNGTYVEFSKSDSAGRAHLACLEGLSYQLEAHIFSGHGLFGKIRNQPVPIVCGKDLGPFFLRLEHESRF